MFNVLHTCLILETVGRFAVVLQMDFQPFLFKSLHKILEKSGENHCRRILVSAQQSDTSSANRVIFL